MLNQVKKDLQNIKFYYSQLREIDISKQTVNYNTFTKKVNLYSQAIDKAEPIFYRLYTSIYVEGLSLNETAEEIGLSYRSVLQKNKELKDFFVKYFTANQIDIKNDLIS